jgi:putative transposase
VIHIEVRKKIIAAREKGLLIREISRAYSCGESAINRLLRQYRDSGDINPKTHTRGGKPALDTQGLEAMSQLILSTPDITLEEIREAMDLRISLAAIRKIINRKLGFHYKKRQYTPVSGTDLMS